MKVSRTKSKRDLPRELWQEILSRLSVNPILRFRCVSKSWQFMIDDPNFCHLHLRRFSNSPQRLLVVTKDVQPERLRFQFGLLPFKLRKAFSLLTDSAFREGYFTLPTPHDSRNWNPLSSIDGLVMLAGDERGALYPSSTSELLLWNPSIRKSCVLPPSPRLPIKMRYVDVGFGFDPLINDYKHVRIAHLDDDAPQFVAIYTVGLGSWKMVPFQSKGSCCWVYFRFCTPCRSRGCLFSIALNRDSKEEELVSFDLRNEVFTSTKLPEADMRFSIKKHLTVVNEECLFVQHTTWGAFVWILESTGTDSDSMYWTKRYLINILNGICTLLPCTQGALEMKETVPNKLEERVIRIITDFPLSIVRLFDYFESLIMLK